MSKVTMQDIADELGISRYGEHLTIIQVFQNVWETYQKGKRIRLF